jgi:hypothetical protein
MDRLYPAGVEEDSLCECCFSGVDVRADANVAEAGKTLCISGGHLLADCFLGDKKTWSFRGFALFGGKFSRGLPSYIAVGEVRRWGRSASEGNRSNEGTSEREAVEAMATGERGTSQGRNCPP